MALRIIAGELKGRKLRSVRGTKTRPTANRIREAIFNILAFRIRGTTVLDLFAGTGAYGVEALSRGAGSVVFVDIDNESISVLRENIANISPESQTKIIRWDLTRNLNCLRSLQPAFNLIFMDPPYNKNMIKPTLHNLHISQSIENGACVVVEHSHLETFLNAQLPFELSDQRRYGKTLVSFLNYML
jgi:16S rRNA (guanine966-N2)-methyltransferase